MSLPDLQTVLAPLNPSERGKEDLKKIRKLIGVVIAIAGLLSASHVAGQRNYDPKTVETIQGKVGSVEKSPSKGCAYGIHLILQMDKETISVHLGPSWYVEKQTPHIEPNDTVTVTGSRLTVDGKPAIMASQVKKGNDVLNLRDENGIPAWRRAGRGNI